jgi:hypothetical protein
LISIITADVLGVGEGLCGAITSIQMDVEERVIRVQFENAYSVIDRANPDPRTAVIAQENSVH